jgi:hypothetical protein
MRRLLLAVVALVTIVPAIALAGGGNPEAKALLEAIYKPYTDGSLQSSAEVSAQAPSREQGAQPEVDEDARNARYYTPEIVALLARDRKEAAERNEVGRLDFDPFTDSQDWEASPVQLTVEDAGGGGKARGAATFTLFNKTSIIRFDLVKIEAGWRVADIHWNDEKEGLKDILGKPLP